MLDVLLFATRCPQGGSPVVIQAQDKPDQALAISATAHSSCTQEAFCLSEIGTYALNDSSHLQLARPPESARLDVGRSKIWRPPLLTRIICASAKAKMDLYDYSMGENH